MLLVTLARRAGSDGSMSASGSAGPGFDPWRGSKFMGQVAQAARRLATGWTARVRSQVSKGWRFSSLPRAQTGPGVHSASYKRVRGPFPGGKGGRA